MLWRWPPLKLPQKYKKSIKPTIFFLYDPTYFFCPWAKKRIYGKRVTNQILNLDLQRIDSWRNWEGTYNVYETISSYSSSSTVQVLFWNVHWGVGEQIGQTKIVLCYFAMHHNLLCLLLKNIKGEIFKGQEPTAFYVKKYPGIVG